jgi:hypothetical protein
MIRRAGTSLAAIAAVGLTLAGCATVKPGPAEPPRVVLVPASPGPAPPPPAPVIVKVPVPVKEACVPKAFPRAPKYPDSDAALRDAGGAADRYQLLAAGRLLRDKRLAELERMIDGCR